MQKRVYGYGLKVGDVLEGSRVVRQDVVGRHRELTLESGAVVTVDNHSVYVWDGTSYILETL